MATAIVYIIYSPTLDKYYTAMTRDSLEHRLHKHNVAHYENRKFTAKANDWQVFFSINCTTAQQALSIEKYIKSMKSKRYIRNLKKYPEISEKLRTKYL